MGPVPAVPEDKCDFRKYPLAYVNPVGVILGRSEYYIVGCQITGIEVYIPPSVNGQFLFEIVGLKLDVRKGFRTYHILKEKKPSLDGGTEFLSVIAGKIPFNGRRLESDITE